MKLSPTIAGLALAFAVVCGALLSPQAAHAVPTKPAVVAVLDVQKAFEGLDEKAEIEIDRKKAIEAFQAESESRKKAIEKLQENMRTMHIEGTPQYEKAEDELFLKSGEYRAWSELEQRRIQRDVAVRLEGVRKKMINTIQDVAESNNIDIVINKETTLNLPTNQQGRNATMTVKTILWNKNTLDITDNVITRMNNDLKRSRTRP